MKHGVGSTLSRRPKGRRWKVVVAGEWGVLNFEESSKLTRAPYSDSGRMDDTETESILLNLIG